MPVQKVLPLLVREHARNPGDMRTVFYLGQFWTCEVTVLPCRVQMDLPLLLREHERNPADTRTVFYLAQTYDLIGDRDAALDTYQKRIDMGGWQQEVFESHLRRVWAYACFQNGPRGCCV